VTAAFLVQQLQGEQTQQCTRGWNHARAGIIRLSNESVESDLRQQRQEEENTSDPRAQAASRRQRDTTHISDERLVWTDGGGAGVLTGRTSTRQRDTTHISDERMVWTDDGGTAALTGRTTT